MELPASPNSTALPKDDIVKKSTIVDADGSGLTPPKSNPLVALLPLASLATFVEESPKSIEFPVDPSVTNSIIFTTEAVSYTHLTLPTKA